MLRLLTRSNLPPQNPNSNLLLLRHVSGTAKGKGKLKDGQQLKRSTITRKKPSSDSAAPSRGSGKREAIERLTRMVDSCLTAPTPVRHLTPKQRSRELEREKLGLISKDRQRELDQQKKKNKEEEEPVIMGTPGLDYVTLGLVDIEKVPKYELTVEDGRRLAKEYSRALMRKHRERGAVESGLLRLKKEAIEALPEGLREKALELDLKPLPEDRMMASLTPPIDGYIEKVNEAAKKFAGKEKLR